MCNRSILPDYIFYIQLLYLSKLLFSGIQLLYLPRLTF